MFCTVGHRTLLFGDDHEHKNRGDERNQTCP